MTSDYEAWIISVLSKKSNNIFEFGTCSGKTTYLMALNSNKDALSWALKSEREDTIALVFGREDRGLSNEELLKANKVISLNTSEIYPSLILSHLNQLYLSII